jgi:hypothetical protein
LDSQLVSSRTVLLVAYHFPPMRGSSGMQRTLRFAQYLPKFGWRPIVLTIHPSAYEATGEAVGNEVSPDLLVTRAFGVNAAERLSVFGRYPAMLALPDRWSSWRFWAVPQALRIIRREAVDAVWSTFPIATAHRIGLEVSRRSRLPWVAEFRDPMWQHDWPPEPKANRAWIELEREIFGHASRMVFTTPGARDMYVDRFPATLPARFRVIENGFDEDAFSRAAEMLPPQARPPIGDRPIVLVHSGIIYSSERDPTQFFAAIAELKSEGAISAAQLRIVLRASGNEVNYAQDLARSNIADIVVTEPAIDYVDALREMLTVDGLLILQASNCNAQIPAKLYEYLRAGRPILALSDPAGDTARALEGAGAGLIARLDSVSEIKAALMQFVAQIKAGTSRRPPMSTVAQYSREAQTGKLAALLDEVVSETGR